MEMSFRILFRISAIVTVTAVRFNFKVRVARTVHVYVKYISNIAGSPTTTHLKNVLPQCGTPAMTNHDLHTEE